MSDEDNTYSVDIKDGDTWSKGKALTITIMGKRNISFPNDWDSEIPSSQDWRKLAGTKIDFSEIKLDSSEEEIQKKKEQFLAQYPAPKEEQVDEAFMNYDKAEKEYLWEIDFANNIYSALTAFRVAGANEDNFDKHLEYFNEVIDVVSKGAGYGERHAVKNPFAKWYKIHNFDPAGTLKDGSTFANNWAFEDNPERFTKLVQEVKDYLPKTYEEYQTMVSNPSEIPDFARDVSENKFSSAYEDSQKAKKDLKEVAMKLGMHDLASRLFDEQLSDHQKALNEEKMKAHIGERKEAIKSSLDSRKTDKSPSGVVMADKVADLIIEENKHHEKLQDLGFVGKDEKRPMMTPDKVRTEISKFQKNMEK